MRDIKNWKHLKVNKPNAVLKRQRYGDFSSEDLIRLDEDAKLACKSVCFTDSSVCGLLGAEFNCKKAGEQR